MARNRSQRKRKQTRKYAEYVESANKKPRTNPTPPPATPVGAAAAAAASGTATGGKLIGIDFIRLAMARWPDGVPAAFQDTLRFNADMATDQLGDDEKKYLAEHLDEEDEDDEPVPVPVRDPSRSSARRSLDSGDEEDDDEEPKPKRHRRPERRVHYWHTRVPYEKGVRLGDKYGKDAFGDDNGKSIYEAPTVHPWSNAAIRRVALKAGASRMQRLLFEPFRKHMTDHTLMYLEKAITYARHNGRKTLQLDDLKMALRFYNKSLLI